MNRWLLLLMALCATTLLWTCSDDPVIGDFNAFEDIPKGLTASTDRVDSSIHVSWNSVVNATAYNLRRTDDPKGSYELIATETEDTSFIDRELQVGRNYYYTVSAVFGSSSDTSVSSEKVMGVALIDTQEVIAVPRDLSATTNRTDTTIILTWKYTDSFSKFLVYRSEKSDGSNAKELGYVRRLEENTLCFWDADIKCNMPYYYAVRAVFENDTSSLSNFVFGFSPNKDDNKDSLKVIPPSGLTATTDRPDTSIQVSWQSVKNAIGYQVVRSEKSSGSDSMVIADMTTGTSMVDQTIMGGVDYYYAVKTLYADTTSAFTAYVRGFAPAQDEEDFPEVISLQATDGRDLNGIGLSWGNCGDDANYDLYVSAFGESDYTLLKENLSDTTYEHAEAVPGPVTYKVIAYNSKGDSVNAIDEGYRLVTPKEFFLEVNKTYKHSQAKIGKLNEKELGKESAGGDIHGTLEYDSYLSGFKAKAKLTYDNYKDFYLTLNGVQMTNIDGLISQDGDVSDTVKVSGIYKGFVDHHITVDGGDPNGGYYTVGIVGVDTADVLFSDVKDAVLD